MAARVAGKKISILLVEKSNDQRELIGDTLSDYGYLVTTVSGCKPAGDKLDQQSFDLVLLSWQTSGAKNFALKLFELFPDTQLIVLSDEPCVDDAVHIMRLGAQDYLAKDCSIQILLESIDHALGMQGSGTPRCGRKGYGGHGFSMKQFVGHSPAMQEVFKLIRKVSATDATVLVMGESGTGKELVARAVHHQSLRNLHPLIPVNCGAIPEDLLESELFGHERGAFTGAVKTRLGRFEMAEGGTVFLDEIADMSPMLQVKLLRVLQEHHFERIGGVRTIDVDIRIIAATNQNLRKAVDSGRFREDLYYRLNVVPIQVPPLRERKSDIPYLCEFFLKRLASRPGMEKKRLHPEVQKTLLAYHWPGNVRELENLLERMVVLAEGPELVAQDLPLHMREKAERPFERSAPARLLSLEVPEDGLDFNAEVDAFERVLITKALERTGWVKNQAAALLRLNRTTLVEKIKKKGLSRPVVATS
jgi:DNA-binding NtrC family response regulator